MCLFATPRTAAFLFHPIIFHLDTPVNYNTKKRPPPTRSIRPTSLPQMLSSCCVGDRGGPSLTLRSGTPNLSSYSCRCGSEGGGNNTGDRWVLRVVGGALCCARRGEPHHELLVRSWRDRRRLGGVAWQLMIGGGYGALSSLIHVHDDSLSTRL